MKVRPGKHRSLRVKGDGCHFIGDYETSPNGRYTITWADGHITIAGNLEKGMRHNVPGKFLLLDRSKQIVLGSKARPNNGHVADNGTFVLCDWTFQPNSGVFYAADRSGKPLIERELGRISDCGISPDGRYACCQTVPGDREDANKLHFFDLSTGELLWAKEPETSSRNKSYRFDTKKGLLYLVYPEWGPLAYSFAGEFLDAQKWQQRRTERERSIKTSHALKVSSSIQTREATRFSEYVKDIQTSAPDEDINAIGACGTNGAIGTDELGETTEVIEVIEAIEAIEDIKTVAVAEHARDEVAGKNGKMKRHLATTLSEQVAAPQGRNGATSVSHSEELEKQLADATAEHARLKAQLAEAFSAHKKELVEQRAAATAQLAGVTTEYKQLIETLKADTAKQLELLQSQIARIEQERDESADQAVELARQREAALQEKNDAAAQLARVTAKSKKQVDELTRARDQLAKDRDQLQERLNQALADGHKQAQALAQQRKATKQHEQQAAKPQSLETGLRDRVQALTKERDQIAHQRDRLAAQLAGASAKAAEHSDSLRQQLEAVVKERDEIAARLAAVETELRDRTGSLARERDAPASECESVVAQLTATTASENIETDTREANKTDRSGEAVEPIAANEAGEPTEADGANKSLTKAIADVEATEPITIESICAIDAHIRALERITDAAARRNRGQEIFTVLGEAWQNAGSPIAQAEICRSLGNLFEALDLPDKAIQSYERALIYDETADVKHRLSCLKRKASKATRT